MTSTIIKIYKGYGDSIMKMTSSAHVSGERLLEGERLGLFLERIVMEQKKPKGL